MVPGCPWYGIYFHKDRNKNTILLSGSYVKSRQNKGTATNVISDTPIMRFVGYDVCRLMMFVGDDICWLITVVAYDVCPIMTSVTNYDVCHLFGLCSLRLGVMASHHHHVIHKVSAPHHLFVHKVSSHNLLVIHKVSSHHHLAVHKVSSHHHLVIHKGSCHHHLDIHKVS